MTNKNDNNEKRIGSEIGDFIFLIFVIAGIVLMIFIKYEAVFGYLSD